MQRVADGGPAPSWQAVLASALLRRTMKPLLRRASGVDRVRFLFGLPQPVISPGTRVQAETVGGVRGEWVTPVNAPRAPVLLYLHGGGYVACSPRTHRPITTAFAERGLRVFAPDYRLAPEAPFPAALDDALAVYRALRATLDPTTPLLLAGDSAGGGLALALLLALRDGGDAIPAAAALLSPLTDLVSEGGSKVANAEICAFFDERTLDWVRAWYLQGHDAADPLVSPLCADLRGLPPLLIHVGRDEVLRDDATLFAQKAREAGVDVKIVTWPAVPHVWQLFRRFIPEANTSLDAMAAFLKRAAFPSPDVDVLIVGSGFSGLAMALRLQQAGRGAFLILEKADDVGGTWRDNTYPGCACDVPSYLYSYAREPQADWSRMYAPQPEIQAYIRDIVERHGLRRRIRFGTALVEARWDETARLWRAATSTGDRITARVLVSGIGGLSRPSLPNIPGRDTFRGVSMHSATWDHAVDLGGKRVAVIGSAASAVQLVPEVAREAAHLTMFQRTPSWVLPRRDRPFTEGERALLRRSPLARCLLRQGIYWAHELPAIGFVLWPGLMRVAEWAGKRHMAASIQDEALRRKLTPSYRIGCKRILTSNDYYPALARPNVEVVTERIAEIRPEGVATVDGRLHEADAIVFATGFRVTDPLHPLRITGRDGVALDDAWRDHAQAYRGVAVAGFPNLFLLVGPNTGLGHSSILFMIEAQVDYVMKCLERMQARGARVMVVRREAQHRWNARLQRRMRRTVWMSGCRSWYLDAHGRNTTLWPGFTFSYWASLLRPCPRDYEFE